MDIRFIYNSNDCISKLSYFQNNLVSTKQAPAAQDTSVAAPLSAEQERPERQQQQQQQQESQSPITSEEFDRFLAERSFAGQERISSTRSNQGATRQMQMMAADPKEDHMFAL